MVARSGIILVNSLGSGGHVKEIGEGQHLDEKLEGHSLGMITLGELLVEIIQVGKQSWQLRGTKRDCGVW